MDESFRLIL